MVLVHVIGLLRRLFRALSGTLAEARQLRQQMSRRYPQVSE